MTEQDFLTITEVCEHLRLSDSTVRRMLRDGRLAGVRIAGRWRIPRAAVEAYLGGDDPLALLSALAHLEGNEGDAQAVAVFQRVQAEIPGLLERVRTLAETGDEETRRECEQVLDVAACLERVGARGELDDKIMAFLGALTVYAGARRLLRTTH